MDPAVIFAMDFDSLGDSAPLEQRECDNELSTSLFPGCIFFEGTVAASLFLSLELDLEVANKCANGKLSFP